MSSSEGRLECIVGPMYAGKTEELIRRLRRVVIAKQRIQVFKPHIDVRYGLENIVSHSALDLEKVTGVKPTVAHIRDVHMLYNGARVVGIEEVQFFEPKIIDTINGFVKDGVRVIVSGLDLDYTGKPFGVIADLLALADEVTKLTAICSACFGIATRTHRKVLSDTKQVVVGGNELYEARCKECWLKDWKP